MLYNSLSRNTTTKEIFPINRHFVYKRVKKSEFLKEEPSYSCYFSREPLATCASFLRLQDILANKPHSFGMIKRSLALSLFKFAQRTVLGSAFRDEVAQRH